VLCKPNHQKITVESHQSFNLLKQLLALAKDYGLHKVRYVEMKQELGAKGCNNLDRTVGISRLLEILKNWNRFRGMLRKQTS